MKKERLIEKFSMLKGNAEFEALISNEELSIEEWKINFCVIKFSDSKSELRKL